MQPVAHVSFTSNDGWTRYFSGSFTSYKDAVKHQNDMLLRGFEGSFVVAFKDGKKIGLYSAIRGKNDKLPRRSSSSKTITKVEKKELKPNLKFVVQIGLYKENVSADILDKMTKIGNVNKENLNGIHATIPVAPGSDKNWVLSGKWNEGLVATNEETG